MVYFFQALNVTTLNRQGLSYVPLSLQPLMPIDFDFILLKSLFCYVGSKSYREDKVDTGLATVTIVLFGLPAKLRGR